MSAYALVSDLATYLGVEESTLSTDSSRLLDRASELVDYYALGRIDATNTDHIAAAVSAVCAQVEYWQNQGEDEDLKRPISGYATGKTQVQFADGGSHSRLAPRARQALLKAGLLYAGASVGRGGGY